MKFKLGWDGSLFHHSVELLLFGEARAYLVLTAIDSLVSRRGRCHAHHHLILLQRFALALIDHRRRAIQDYLVALGGNGGPGIHTLVLLMHVRLLGCLDKVVV